MFFDDRKLLMKSNQYIVIDFEKHPWNNTNKPWKTKAEPWNNLKPGDTFTVEFNFDVWRWHSKYQPEFTVYAYRNGELLFETTNTPAYISNFLKHFLIKEVK